MNKSHHDFQPPHCPNRDCPHHRETAAWRYIRAGSYRRLIPPFRVQRFRCRSCGVSFSRQSFATTYWLKRPDLLETVFLRVLSCSSYRQISRELGVAHSTVLRLVERLGRHCLLWNEKYRPETLPDEPLVLDGFESFEFSQYHPCHFHLSVGAQSHWFHAFTDSELRRKGRMTAHQRKRRAWLEAEFGRPDPKSIEKEMAELLRLTVREPGEVTVLSDEHPAYPRAFRRVEGVRVRHEVTSSRKGRTVQNPLFPVNLLDMLIRHCGANHKRETIAFSKRRQSAAERLALLQTWRNWLKSFSEKAKDGSPAMRLGLVDRLLTVGEVLAWRLFPRRVQLPARVQRYYDREVETRRIPEGRRHVLTYAY